MEGLKQKILEHLADLLDEAEFELDMILQDCKDPKTSDKSDLHLLMTDAAFKAFCTYFNKKDETEQCNIKGVGSTLCEHEPVDLNINPILNRCDICAEMKH